MYSYLSQTVPTVIISNTSEAFYNYMSRAGDEQTRARLIEEMQTLGDRNLLYPKNEKLVIVSAPIPHADSLLQQLGYSKTQYAHPQYPSPFLSLDILKEPILLDKIINFTGSEKTIQLIPHATTAEFFKLAQVLRDTHQINVLLPESPAVESLWLRDYIDTKSGFRLLTSNWLSKAHEQLLEGFVCQAIEQAAEVIYWFVRQEKACLVKGDRSNDALGHTIFLTDELLSLPEILQRLKRNLFLNHDLIIVEEYVVSSRRMFPSVECFVPPPDVGQPEMTYVCNQIFHESGTFAGLLISRDFENESWYLPLVTSGLQIAQKLQIMGYVGHFDLDAIVDDAGQLFLLEINARRTGGTHVHELACSLWRSQYLEQVVLLSNSAMDSGKINQFDQLYAALKPVLYPMKSLNSGIIITHSSGLSAHRFGCVMIAASVQQVLELQQQVIQIIQAI
jgi:hypothetical protein